MKKRRGRPPKPPDERKGILVAFRTEDAEKGDYERAAGSAGVSLSDWIRDRLKAAAQRELRRAKR